MRLKPESNIDKEARLPEGIEFRADLLWSKIEEKRKLRKKKPVFWWVAAACAVLAITYVFFPSLEKTPAGQPLISKAEKPKVERVEERSLSVEEKLPVEIILKKVKQEGFIPKAEKSIAAISDSIPDFDFVTIEKQKVVLPLIANTPIKNASEEPALSPSALRLRERLQQLNPDSLAQQVIIEEKFNFFNELQRSYTHAYTNETTSPVLNNFLKNKDENN